MRLDAWEDLEEERRRNEPPRAPEPVYIPGYYPDEDPWYDLTYKQAYHGDLYLASQNYWAGKTGQPDPPPPSYGKVHGQMKLGRYLDVYGCQAWLRHMRHVYLGERSVCWGLIVVSLATGWIGGPIGFAAAILASLIMLALLVPLRFRYSRRYRTYYDAQRKILETGEPVWLPYPKAKLREIRNNPGQLWP